MAQSKHDIQAMLAEIGGSPRQRFGQNFMIDQNLVRLVAEAGAIAPGDVVIEVGPGTGTLTEELLAQGADVVAVEIDRDLADLLRKKFAGNERFRLIEGDALAGKHQLNDEVLAVIRREPSPQPSPGVPGEGVIHGRDAHATLVNHGQAARATKLIANLPYNIASPLIIEMLIAGVELLAFTVQKEVADRLRAPAGTEAYGPLSVTAQMLAKVELLRTLPPQAFWPMPKIDSALVRMMRQDRIGGRAPEFGRFVQKIFSSRRKMLRKAMTQAGYDEKPLLKLGIDPTRRPEELSPEQFFSLFEVSV